MGSLFSNESLVVEEFLSLPSDIRQLTSEYLPISLQLLLMPKLSTNMNIWRDRLEREFKLEGKLLDFEDTDKPAQERLQEYYTELSSTTLPSYTSMYLLLNRHLKPELKKGGNLVELLALHSNAYLCKKLEDLYLDKFVPRHMYDEEFARLLVNEAKTRHMSLPVYIETIVKYKLRSAEMRSLADKLGIELPVGFSYQGTTSSYTTCKKSIRNPKNNKEYRCKKESCRKKEDYCPRKKRYS